MGCGEEIAAHRLAQEAAGRPGDDHVTEEYLQELHKEMMEAAQRQDYEQAAELRDRIRQLKGEAVATPQPEGKGKWRRGQRR